MSLWCGTEYHLWVLLLGALQLSGARVRREQGGGEEGAKAEKGREGLGHGIVPEVVSEVVPK